MLDLVAVIDPKSFGDAFSPLVTLLLLGWSVSEGGRSIALVSRRPWRSHKAGDTVHRPSAFQGASVDRHSSNDAIVNAYHVGD